MAHFYPSGFVYPSGQPIYPNGQPMMVQPENLLLDAYGFPTMYSNGISVMLSPGPGMVWCLAASSAGYYGAPIASQTGIPSLVPTGEPTTFGTSPIFSNDQPEIWLDVRQKKPLACFAFHMEEIRVFLVEAVDVAMKYSQNLVTAFENPLDISKSFQQSLGDALYWINELITTTFSTDGVQLDIFVKMSVTELLKFFAGLLDPAFCFLNRPNTFRTLHVEAQVAKIKGTSVYEMLRVLPCSIADVCYATGAAPRVEVKFLETKPKTIRKLLPGELSVVLENFKEDINEVRFFMAQLKEQIKAIPRPERQEKKVKKIRKTEKLQNKHGVVVVDLQNEKSGCYALAIQLDIAKQQCYKVEQENKKLLEQLAKKQKLVESLTKQLSEQQEKVAQISELDSEHLSVPFTILTLEDLFGMNDERVNQVQESSSRRQNVVNSSLNEATEEEIAMKKKAQEDFEKYKANFDASMTKFNLQEIDKPIEFDRNLHFKMNQTNDEYAAVGAFFQCVDGLQKQIDDAKIEIFKLEGEQRFEMDWEVEKNDVTQKQAVAQKKRSKKLDLRINELGMLKTFLKGLHSVWNSSTGIPKLPKEFSEIPKQEKK